MAGFEEFINNPMTMMGLGILGGNYGRNSRDAFSNSMQGGLAGMQMGQLSSMRRKQQEREQAEFELKQKQYEAMKQQARMQATAFGLDPNMFDDSNDVISFYNAKKGTGTQQNLAHYMSPEGQAQIDYISKKYGIPPADIIKMSGNSTNINMGEKDRKPYLTDEEKLQGGFDPEQPMVWGKDGVPKPVKATAFTEGQLQAANYADRMYSSSKGMNDLVTKGFEPGQLLAHVAGEIPIVGNAALTSEQQQYLQLARDWIRSKLRKESGAVINPDEWKKEYETYFPMPFDTPENIERKRQSRDVAARGMVRMSGGAYKPPEIAAPTSDDDPLGLR